MVDWLLLLYRLPVEPSRHRVAVWRHLRRLGAVHLEGGTWALPHNLGTERSIREVATTVRESGGVAFSFVAHLLDAEQEEEMRRRYNDARVVEYNEVFHECEKLLAHVEREKQEERFEFNELEELEEDLEKIERWLERVQQRDVFGVPTQGASLKAIQSCRDALASFAHETYQHASGDVR